MMTSHDIYVTSHIKIMAVELNNDAVRQLLSGQSKASIAIMHDALRCLWQGSPTSQEETATSSKGGRLSYYFSSTSHVDLLVTPELHSYNPLQYDEGVNTFANPLMMAPEFLLSPNTKALIEAIIYFNLGLASAGTTVTMLQCEDEDSTNQFFQKSLDCSISADQISTSPSSLFLRVAALHNIGHIYFSGGQYAHAIDLYSLALEILLQRMQLLHCSTKNSVSPSSLQDSIRDILLYTAGTYNCIAMARYYAQDQHTYPSEETLSMLTRALSIYDELRNSKARSGMSQHDTRCRASATIINNIGRIKFAASDYNGALLAYKETLKYRTSLLGVSHLDVAVCLYNIAESFNLLGDVEEAIRYYNQYLVIAIDKLGEDHEDVADVFTTLGQLCYTSGELKDAQKFYKRALQSSIAVYGRNHAHCASIYNTLGCAAFEDDDPEQALMCYKSGLEIELNLDHSLKVELIPLTLVNIANVLHVLGRYRDSLTNYAEALDWIDAMYGPSSEQRADVLVNIALLHEKEEEYNLAENRLEEAIAIKRELHGRTFALSLLLNTLGTIHSTRERYGLALDTFLESIQIRVDSPESSGSDVANVLYNAARTCCRLGEKEKALSYFQQSLFYDRKGSDCNGEGGQLVPLMPTNMWTTMIEMASLQMEMEQFEEALKHYRDALDVWFQYRHGMVGVHVQQIYAGMQNCYTQMMLRSVNESSKTNGRNNLAPAA